MNQQDLWHDSLEESLKAIVAALGGPKRVAGDLWPGKSIVDAARLLNHCLDPERSEKLALSEVLWLIKKGREVQCHTAMAFLCNEAGYQPPVPVEPEDERARLQREYIEATKLMARIHKDMTRVQA